VTMTYCQLCTGVSVLCTLISPNSITPTSPELPRDTCHWEVSGFQTIHRDMSRWFENFPWKVGSNYKPVCVRKTEKSATSATRHGTVSDVADKSFQIHTADTDGTKLFCRIGVGGVNTPVGSRDPVYNFLC